MCKKALFFDVDGTLIDSYHGEHEIRSTLMRQLNRLKDAGHQLFISSGRPKKMLSKYLLSLGFDGYILANGGYVEISGQSVYQERLDYNLGRKTCDMLEELGCEYMIETANHIYIRPEYTGLYNFFEQFHPGIFTTDFDRDEVLHRTIKIEANVFNVDKQSVLDSIQENIDFVINYDTHGTDNAFEFFSPTMSKAVGIEKALTYLGIDRKDTYAFGDGTNDIEMLKYCHVGVAMGNSPQEVVEVADIVCEPIEKDGLTNFLASLQ